jgi:lipid A oxidase
LLYGRFCAIQIYNLKAKEMITRTLNILRIAALGISAALATTAARAESELSFYGGYQTAPHSTVTSPDGSTDFVKWLGKSFEPPPYYGVRATIWNDAGFGWGLDINHAKVYADNPASYGYDRMEFTDGLNIITATVMQRYDARGRFTPYIGAGLGVAIPHVDIQPTGQAHTFGYQLTGPAIKWIAGLSMPISPRLNAFAEYTGTYSDHKVDLVSGGTLRTDMITNALNIGISLKF